MASDRDPKVPYFAAVDTEQFEFVQERNVIVVGRSGVGKSMLINQIAGGSYMEFSNQPNSRTKNASVIAGCIRYERKKYHCSFIDTVGFSDTRQKNEAIMQEIRFIMQDRKQIHLVIFTFKLNEYFDHDKKQWDLFVKSFRDTIYNISAAVITHCDNYTDDAKQSLRNTLLQGEKTSSFFALMSQGIHCVGFPDTSKIMTNEEIFTNINRDAKEIRALIAKCNNPVICAQMIKPHPCTIA